MGVTVLQQFPMVESRSGPQTIEFLTKRIVALGAVQTGHFLVDCETFLSIPNLGVEEGFLGFQQGELVENTRVFDGFTLLESQKAFINSVHRENLQSMVIRCM